jgi:hypothetical protein
VAILIFAALDAQYLRLERRFRLLFERARLEDWSTLPTFDFDLANAPSIRLRPVFFSWSIGSYYLPLVAGVLALYLIWSLANGRFV